MPFTQTMPKVSPTMEEGSIAKWHKKEGDYVESGELLVEIASDKATVEFEALDSGYLRKILVPDGGEARVNAPIAILSESSDESLEGYEPEGTESAQEEKVTEEKEGGEEPSKKEPAAPQARSGTTFSQPIFAPEPPLEEGCFTFPTEELPSHVKASPLAKKMAKEQGLDLTTVKGTGPGGRVVKTDLAHAQKAGVVTFGSRERPTKAPGSFEEESLTPMRKAIGRRLQEAKTFIPHFYVTQAVCADAMVDLRTQLKQWNLKVTFNDFIVRACALALREHPVINSGFNTANQTITRYQTIDISIAVSIDNGLITPIVRHADYKNLGQLSVEIRELALRARDGKLEPHEYKGGSFTISNLGMYGITEFVAVINPPQAAILAVSGMEEVPLVKKGKVVVGKQLHLTLSSDHRVIDGAAAAQFLKTVQKYLENPAGLLL